MNIYKMLEEPAYKDALLDSLCVGNTSSSDFRDILEIVINKHLYKFEEFDKPLYEGDENISELILPCIRKLWISFFVNPSILLTGNFLNIYQMSFDIDEFINHLIHILKSNNSIESLKNIDRSATTLGLIVDDYVSMKFKFAYNSNEIVYKEFNREFKIKKIINK